MVKKKNHRKVYLWNVVIEQTTASIINYKKLTKRSGSLVKTIVRI